MKRILIIGNSGAGKSTFAVKLAKKLNLPLIHLDKIRHTGNWQTVSKEEFNRILQTELEKPEWIIDGNYRRTIPHRLKYCDTVFYLDFPAITCLYGVFTRLIKYRGKTRPDMGGNCPERFDWEFTKYVINYNKNYRKENYEMFNNADGVELIVFKSRKDIKKYLKK